MGHLSVTRNVARLFPRKQELADQFYKTARVSMETCALRGGMRFQLVDITCSSFKR